MDDLISRQAAIEALHDEIVRRRINEDTNDDGALDEFDTEAILRQLPSVQPEPEKYEYHYDHTDCIWYSSEARNRCPTTCAQYRDGWNDAMNYIFRDGKGYRPFRRDRYYEE